MTKNIIGDCRPTWNLSDCFTHRRNYDKCLALCNCNECRVQRERKGGRP